MPVFATMNRQVLIVTVDGDYTPEELRRVGAAALAEVAQTRPVAVLMDMSGAAGLSKRTTAEIRGTAEFFAAQSEKLSRVAILAPTDFAFGLMSMAGTFSDLAGLAARPFRVREDAMAWLEEDPQVPTTPGREAHDGETQ